MVEKIPGQVPKTDSSNRDYPAESKKAKNDLPRERVREDRANHDHFDSKPLNWLRQMRKDIEARQTQRNERGERRTDTTKPEKAASKFEKHLNKTRKGEIQLPSTPSGKKAAFAAKSEASWKLFFTNILSRGSSERLAQKASPEVLEALFRGLIKNTSGNGPQIVADLQLAGTDRKMMEKFARVLIENPGLLEKWAHLSPGDSIPADFFKDLGETFAYLQLVHEGEVAEIPKNFGESNLQQMKNPFGIQARQTLETRLEEERARRASRKNSQNGVDEAGFFSDLAAFRGKEGEKEPRKAGLPRWWVGLFWVVAAVSATLLISKLFF